MGANQTSFYSKPAGSAHESHDHAHDHIDSDNPQSGVATPKPDPSDKRLPGITSSYFNAKVGSGSSTSPTSGPLETPALGTESDNPLPIHRREQTHEQRELQLLSSSEPIHETADELREDGERGPDNDVDDDAPPLLPHERVEHPQASLQIPADDLHAYPTPPPSKSPSLHKLKLSDSPVAETPGAESTGAALYPAHRKSISESFPSTQTRRGSIMNPLSSIVTTSTVHASHFSNPSESSASTVPITQVPARVASTSPVDSPSYDRLKKLTDDAVSPREKGSPPASPRPVSSQGQASDSVTADNATQSNGAFNGFNGEDAANTDISTDSSSAAIGPKGNLIVKIVQARGLRPSHEPYIVAVFQRNELVSKAPKSDDDECDDDDEDAARAPAMARTDSETHRAMAIPMKSRQSSSTSLTDHRLFKDAKRRKSMTSPKWDTEATL